MLVYFGAPSYQIERGDVGPLYRLLQEMGPQDKAAVVIQSSGGDADTAHRLVALLREYIHDLHVYVPSYAASAATLFCLGADSLWMGPISELSPIDPQVPVDIRLLIPTADETQLDVSPSDATVPMPAHVIRDFLELTGVIETDTPNRPRVDASRLDSLLKPLNPWILGWYERATKVSRLYATEALKKGLLRNASDAPSVARTVVHRLLDEHASHNASIVRAEARDLGIPVQDCPSDIWEELDKLSQYYDEVLQGGIVRIIETLEGFHAIPLRRQRPCPSCSELFEEDASFHYCPHCGTQFGKSCVQCGRPHLEDGWRFCPRCGEQIVA